ncbi:hypothetical protein [Algoriphagus sp.]|uniref:hypothetical protein n=1 Tax=Algoriphagus sp. TaxID=1872435 RepID=UPI00391AADC8
MKKLPTLLILMIWCTSVFAKDPETKTYLVIFKSKELKENKISLKEIGSQFSSFFNTKFYTGNSELALVIETSICDMDDCFLGKFLINLDGGKQVQLQQIAYRLFDLTENKALHQRYLAMYEERLTARKKASKSPKPDSKP